MFRRIGFPSWLAGLVMLTCIPQPVRAQGTATNTQVLITQAVDERNLAVLRGNTRPEAIAQNDRGAVADGLPMDHLLLQLRRAPEQESALQRYLDEVQDPTSANFHKWLTAEQFGQQFGAAQQDLDTITRWLESHGFSVNLVYPNRMVIDFSGTAGQVRGAFHTEIHNLEVRGEKHIANMRDPQIPAALAPAIVGIVSLHDFKPRAQHEMRRAAANYTFNSPVNGPTYAVVPADLATIYNLSPLFKAGYSGQGQTIVVIEDTNVFKTTDWATFRNKFGLSSYTSGSFTTSHPAPLSGPNNCTNPGVVAMNDGEAIIDAEWASAAAPSAAIQLASCADTSTTFGGLIALQNLINASGQPPALVSISYGECETENGGAANAAFNAAYQQAVSEGVSIFVSAGDSGAAACDNPASAATHGIGANAFASTPYNVAVGGTDFSDTYNGTNDVYWNSTNAANFGSALSYVPEIPWNDSCAGVLVTDLFGEGISYGDSGFCNDTTLGVLFLTTTAGGGGPSGCATGSPAVAGVVGGTCAGWAKPSWQALLSNFGNPTDGVRDTPDVALFAANGLWSHYYIFCWSDTANGGAACAGAPSNWSGAGGTSFGAPIMAGIQALINQKAGRQGNPNPAYYQLAASEYNTSSSACNSSNGNGVASTCIFYDVTQADMDVNCTGTYNCYLPSGTEGALSTTDNSYSPAYVTTTGWDFATGIGSVNAANLVNNWPSTLFSPPPAPTLVSAVGVSPSEIDLTWTNPAGSNATGNSVLRCTSSSCTPMSTIANLAATATSYQDKSAAASTAYTYLIQATGTGGSTNSNTLSATTLVANQPPVAVSVTPSSGSGLGPQTFSYLYTDGSGYQNISFAESILGTSANLTGSCSTMYVPATSGVYLMNDAGGSWLGPLKIGQSGTLQNSQCTLNAQTSSASGSGTSLTVNLALSFQPTFIGLLNNFMHAQDTVNNFTSGVQNRGTWTASAIMAPDSGSITAQGDFDGDGKADIAIFRPASGTWYIIPSSNPGTPIVQSWGLNGDIPVPGDYDGDGKTDFAVWRPSTGTWYIIPSSNPGTPIVQSWGLNGDIPVPGDYDGDRKTDFAVWRPSTGQWFIIPSSNPGTPIVQSWGLNGDIPVPGDYDGDRKTDFAVWRPSTGTWYIIPSSNPGTPIVRSWGLDGDIPVAADYDGDGKMDMAVFRPSNGTWYIIPSSNPVSSIMQQWGTLGDIPVAKDYEGEGDAEIAVWRPSLGAWYIILSTTPPSSSTTFWGTSTDIPVE